LNASPVYRSRIGFARNWTTELVSRASDTEVRERIRQSGRCKVSRAVSDLVRAGLIRRHSHGYRVDHHNRGAQREAVYTITESAASALS
jgi:predicted transcriptional regulator